MKNTGVSRRELLTGIGATGALALVGTGTAGATSADRHIVGTSTEAATNAAKRRADSVHRVLDFDDIGQAVAGRFSEEALDNLDRNPNVRYIEADGEMRAIGQTLPWGIDRVDADVLHDNGEAGSGADIAIIDTGIDDDHPDLQANVGAGEAFVDCTGSNCNYAWSDDHNHGTHCAGIADAVNNTEGVVGVATEATLHAVKVLDGDGAGTFSDVAAGIEHVADQGWDVGSMSIGASSGSSTVRDACQYAYDNGVLLVAAAGNDGPCSDCVSYPAAYSTVVAVSSTDSDDSLSSFSSTGPEIELAAPGGSIYSTVIDGYATYSGTSMACPHVSGAGGQLMADGYTNTEARSRLQDTAEDVGLSSNEQGNGLLDAEAAVLGVDAAPSVSWVNPTDGETVSGTVTVQIDASDSEDSDDSLDVTYTVDGGSSRSTSYDSTSGYYEDDWDTTGVSDGEHTLEATATDSAGNTTTASIAVTTDNTESPPAVDSLSLSEVETGDSDAEFDADWSVSDADGDLSSVDLVLTQDSDGSTEDSATVSVSGDTASGTTRLVAAGDEGTGNSYTVEATVTDGAGNTDSATASATESEATPAVDSLSASEAETSDSDAEFDASWDVSDGDGDLDSLDLVLIQDSDGSTEDSATVSVSGSSDSGTTRLVAAGDDGSGNSYTVEATVTDSYGNTGSGSTSVSETEDTDSPPTIDSYAVTEAGSPNPHAEITADWTVGDSDGDLDTVVIEVIDADTGSVVDSASHGVSGSGASGTDQFKIKHARGGTFDVTLTVTDAAGNATAETETVTE